MDAALEEAPSTSARPSLYSFALSWVLGLVPVVAAAGAGAGVGAPGYRRFRRHAGRRSIASFLIPVGFFCGSRIWRLVGDEAGTGPTHAAAVHGKENQMMPTPGEYQGAALYTRRDDEAAVVVGVAELLHYRSRLQSRRFPSRRSSAAR